MRSRSSNQAWPRHVALAKGMIGVISVFFLTACSVHVEMPAVPETHPASPEAAVAPLPEPSPLLDSYRPVESPPSMEEMGHQGHDMSHGMPESEHGEMTDEEHRMHSEEPDADSHHEHETGDEEEPDR